MALTGVAARAVAPARAEAHGLQVAAGFGVLLMDYDMAAINAQAGSVIGAWPDGRIALLNAAWFAFARDNDGSAVLARWKLGDSLLHAISGPLQEYYAAAFARVLQTGSPWEQTYGCPSPQNDRQFRLLVQSLGGKGLLLTHSLVVERSVADADVQAFVSQRYADVNGLVHQCSNCRRVRRVDGPDAWDWLPDLVAHPARNASHGLCAACYGQYMGAISQYFETDAAASIEHD